ncbi:MAG TPA: ANTAR domain-containing protein [Candidatus Acutalibacter stercorigallinarum]|nr:ANTAR domain-containing protein [Candidatus Acutalibacter stercorigallinarum]
MRTPGPEGGRALLALGGEKYRPQWERVLKENGFSQVETASNGGEARRLLLAGDWDLLLIAAPLPDEFGHDLATDAAEQGLPVLLSVKAELWEEASARVGPAGVVALGRPFSRAVFAQAVGMLRAAQAQVGKLREENKKLRQKLEELRAVSRAKCLLVEYLRLDEESAHKYIERAAMEERKTRRAVAEEIIAEYG